MDNFTAVYGSGDKLIVNLVDNVNNLIKFINIDVTVFSDGCEIKNYSCLSGDEIAIDLLPGTYAYEFEVVDSSLSVNPKNITVTLIPTFANLNNTINGNSSIGEIYLDNIYAFNPNVDSGFEDGIVINRPVTIYGNGCIINRSNTARIFKITNKNVKLYNITFVNGNASDFGGAISGNCNAINCTFSDNYAGTHGGGMYKASAINCTFNNNKANNDGGAIYISDIGSAINCTFISNSVKGSGGAVYGSAENCIFINNTAPMGEAMMASISKNCIFIKPSSGYNDCWSVTFDPKYVPI